MCISGDSLDGVRCLMNAAICGNDQLGLKVTVKVVVPLGNNT